MSELYLPKSNFRSEDVAEIQKILATFHVDFERWQTDQILSDSADQETILAAYRPQLNKIMTQRGFTTADVINVHAETPNVQDLRAKFLKEHTHSEDEVRFFVDGAGIFWFHFDDGTIARLICKKGDFLSVPAGYKHWFDLAPYYYVKAIRIFTNKEGWVANYTHSGVDLLYAN